MKCAKCHREIPSLPCPHCGSNEAEKLQEFAKEGTGRPAPES